LLVGLTFTFFGLQIFRPALFLAGFVLTSMIAYVILSRYVNDETWLLVGTIGVGLIGGFIACNIVFNLR
jgi:hypothetical protein